MDESRLELEDEQGVQGVSGVVPVHVRAIWTGQEGEDARVELEDEKGV